MIKKVKTNEGVTYQKLTAEEMKAKGILGRLVGPCADFINPTRNGRKYSEQLWENVFNDPLMQEKIKNKVCYGELGHPADRSEIDPEKVAICLAEQPVKNDKGQLIACFDILDTPNGRILKTLCDYGSTLAISSRGQGDIIKDINGNEEVDPDTYECECWDIVLIPGVEKARLKYVNESFTSKQTLCEALTKTFNNEDEEGKKIMKETLNTLNLKIQESLAKEVKLIDCRKIETYEEACKIVKKLKAPWCFGIESFGAGLNIFKSYTEQMDLYIYEDGENSFSFGVYPSGEIYGPYDLKDRKIEVSILKDLNEISKENNLTEETLTEDAEVETDNVEPTVEIEDSNEIEIDVPEHDETIEDVEETSDIEIEVPTESEEIESDVEEIESEVEVGTEVEPVSVEDYESKTDKEVFLDYLVNNFEIDKVKEVLSTLELDITEVDLESTEDETPVEETTEVEVEETEVEQVEETTETEEVETTPEISSEAEEAEDIDPETSEDENEVVEAIDNGSITLVRNLQEALKSKNDLEENLKSLQEKLAVNDIKVEKINEECNRYKEAITRLSDIAKSKKEIQESCHKLEAELKEKDEIIENQKLRISRLVKSRKEMVSESKNLNESLSSNVSEIEALNESLITLNESHSKEVKELREALRVEKESKNESLNKINTLNKDIEKLNENLTKATKIKESYKNLATKAVNKYIETKANMLGLTSKEIKRKLGESYTIEDVDQVCEDLKSYQIQVTKLPFNLDKKKVSVRVSESVQQPVRTKSSFQDDDVDDSLIRLANL